MSCFYRIGGFMDNKKAVLIRVSYLLELSEEEINTDDSILDKITDQISESKDLHIDNVDIFLEWNSTSSLILDPINFNCGRCSNCGQWTTDREKPDVIGGICNGATFEGRLLCDECLPPDHRWAF